MLTLEHLKIFQKFGGDIDGWIRQRSEHDKAIMTDNDWRLISEFYENLELIKKGLASEDFKLKVISKIEQFTNKETKQHLIEP